MKVIWLILTWIVFTGCQTGKSPGVDGEVAWELDQLRINEIKEISSRDIQWRSTGGLETTPVSVIIFNDGIVWYVWPEETELLREIRTLQR